MATKRKEEKEEKQQSGLQQPSNTHQSCSLAKMLLPGHLRAQQTATVQTLPSLLMSNSNPHLLLQWRWTLGWATEYKYTRIVHSDCLCDILYNPAV